MERIFAVLVLHVFAASDDSIYRRLTPLEAHGWLQQSFQIRRICQVVAPEELSSNLRFDPMKQGHFLRFWDDLGGS